MLCYFNNVQYLFGINPKFVLKFSLCCSLHPYCSVVLQLSRGMERMTTTGVGKVTWKQTNQQLETGIEMKFKDKEPLMSTNNQQVETEKKLNQTNPNFLKVMSLARTLQEIQHSSQELSGYKLARNNSNYQLLIQNLFNITKYYLTLEAFLLS